MIRTAPLSKEAHEVLETYRRYGPSALIRDRSSAIIMNSKETGSSLISEVLSRDIHTIRINNPVARPQGITGA
jgi:site-specific recombinase XerD